MIAVSRKQPDVEGCLRNTHVVNDEFPVGRDICREGVDDVRQQQLFRAASDLPADDVIRGPA